MSVNALREMVLQVPKKIEIWKTSRLSEICIEHQPSAKQMQCKKRRGAENYSEEFSTIDLDEVMFDNR